MHSRGGSLAHLAYCSSATSCRPRRSSERSVGTRSPHVHRSRQETQQPGHPRRWQAATGQLLVAVAVGKPTAAIPRPKSPGTADLILCTREPPSVAVSIHRREGGSVRNCFPFQQCQPGPAGLVLLSRGMLDHGLVTFARASRSVVAEASAEASAEQLQGAHDAGKAHQVRLLSECSTKRW